MSQLLNKRIFLTEVSGFTLTVKGGNRMLFLKVYSFTSLITDKEDNLLISTMTIRAQTTNISICILCTLLQQGIAVQNSNDRN